MKGYTIQHSIDLLEEAVEKGGGSGGATTAADVSFDNTGTGLNSTDVQAAIAEVKDDIIMPFIDTTNVVQAATTFKNETISYTPLVDCFVKYNLVVQNTSASVKIDDVSIVELYSNQTVTNGGILLVKAGQVVKLTSSDTTNDSSYTVYGIVGVVIPTRTKKKK